MLEVIVALVIFGTAALAALTLTREAEVSIEHTREADATLSAASAFLDAISLWPREDLDRHLGDRHEGAWVLHIDRPIATLYRVALYDSTAARNGGAPLLQTALFRVRDTNVQP